MSLRDALRRYLPSWLADDYPDSPSYGFRVLWSIALVVDAAVEATLQGSLAAVGRGTPTALRYLGEERGMLRGQDESAEAYADRLRTWIDAWRSAGSARRLATEIHRYLRSHPRVRVITRSGIWTTVESDGSITMTKAPWNWDGVSHPARASWWSDLWVVVYTSPDQWPLRPGTLGDLEGDDGYALGHLARREEVDAIQSILMQWKAAHSRVRALIWTSDPTRFDPTAPSSCPDGTWGAWGMRSGTSYVPSGRDITTCRYWEPR